MIAIAIPTYSDNNFLFERNTSAHLQLIYKFKSRDKMICFSSQLWDVCLFSLKHVRSQSSSNSYKKGDQDDCNYCATQKMSTRFMYHNH